MTIFVIDVVSLYILDIVSMPKHLIIYYKSGWKKSPYEHQDMKRISNRASNNVTPIENHVPKLLFPKRMLFCWMTCSLSTTQMICFEIWHNLNAIDASFIDVVLCSSS